MHTFREIVGKIELNSLHDNESSTAMEYSNFRERPVEESASEENPNIFHFVTTIVANKFICICCNNWDDECIIKESIVIEPTTTKH
jgi:hypothetical protein